MEERQTSQVSIPSERSSFIACVKGNVKPRISSKRNRENRLYTMTQDFVKTYKKCNADFKAIEVLPQRVLTNPSEGVLNNGFDNEESNLVCKVHDTFAMDGYVFTILDLLGTGTFGQVFRCIRSDTKDLVAVKVVKNKPAYHAQGLLEIKVARLLNESHDPNDERHIVRLLDSFEYRGHVCLVFELLSVSLLDVLTQNQFRGLPLVVVQRFAKQILTALVAFEEADVIHCDLKPENILLVPSCSNPSSPNRKPNNNPNNNSTSETTSSSGSSSNQEASATAGPPRSPPRRTGSSTGGGASDIKVIDFGSACFEGKTMYSYIQSRFYRSPEVLLGLPYNGAIDMWSLACVCAEMFLGLPLFPGVSQHNQLTRIVEMLGLPPDFLIEGKNGQKYFTLAEPSVEVGKDIPMENSPQSVCIGGTGSHSATGAAVNAATTASNHTNTSTTGAGSSVPGIPSKYRLKTAEEFAAETNTQVPVLRKYLRYSRIDDVIMRCPLAQKSRMTPEQKNAETLRRRCFLDFLLGLFRLNPFERWTARQAFSHPFIENTRFVGPYVPPPDMKINERKLNFMVLTQRKPPSSTTTNQTTPGSTSGVIDATALTGVRAPSNFSTVPGLLGNAAQFTPLQLAHRRMSDPGLDHNRIKPSGPQLLKRGAPAHLPPEPEPTKDSGLVTESSIPFSSESSDAFIAIPAVEIARPPSIEHSDRNSGNFGEYDDYSSELSGRLSEEKPLSGGHVAQAILRVNAKSRDVLTANPAGTVHIKPSTGSPTQSGQYPTHASSLPQSQQLPYSSQQQSQSLHSSPQTQMYMHQYRQQQQNYFQRQQQPSTGSPNSKSGPSFPPPRVPYGQHHSQQQYQQHQHQQQSYYNAPSGAYGGYGTGQQQMASSMHMHPNGMAANHTAAASMGTSYNSYGYVGSMQDGAGGVMLTDFALALMRPDMDEQRRLLSQTTPQQLYWQHSYAHGSSPGGMGAGGSYGYGHQGMDNYSSSSSGMPLPAPHQATSYGFPFNMTHMDPRAAHTGYHPPGQTGPPSQSPQMAGSFDSKTMHGRRRQPPHKQDRNISSSNLVEFAAQQQQQQQLPSRQLPHVPADTAEESRANNNNVKRLSGRLNQNKEQYNSRGMSMLQTSLLPSDADLRKPSPTYGNKGTPRARPTGPATPASTAASTAGTTAIGKSTNEAPSHSILINNASPQQLHLQPPTVVAGSYVDASNHTSFHALQPHNATLQQPQAPTAASVTAATVGPGQSFLAMEIERRESFAAASVGASNRDRSSPCSTSASNSSVNSAVNSRQNSVDSADFPYRTRTSGSSLNSSATSTVQRLQQALGTRTLGRTGVNGSNRARRKSASNGQQNSEDVLEEWHPFFEADDLSNNT